jgi:hypothetical protein
VTVIGLLLIAAAIALAFLTGAHAGRTAERYKATLTPVEAEHKKEVFEASLRAIRGLPKIHQSPEEAPRMRIARVKKR